MKLLHIIATPRGEASRTLKVSGAFLEILKKRHPDINIDELDLYKEHLPPLSVRQIDGKYILLSGKDLPEEYKGCWKIIVDNINRFLSADILLLSTPMWNFGIPYELKHYIDMIVQPKYLFQYTESGPQGLAKNKKMVVITSRGGDYSPGTPYHQFDFVEPYLRTVFGFVGISDITFVNAQPMDAGGPEVQAKKIGEAIAEAKKLAETL